MKKLKDKALVAFWMEQRKVNDIIVRAGVVVIEARPSLTQAEAEELVRKCGHEDDYRAATDGAHRYIVLPRY